MMLLTPSQQHERDGLLADVLAHPHDDAPRLIFADWCEDHGEAERADLVRLQIELAALRQKAREYGPTSPPPAMRERMGVLARRQAASLEAHADEWVGPDLPRLLLSPDGRRPLEEYGLSPACEARTDDKKGWIDVRLCEAAVAVMALRFSRGFVDEVRGRLDALTAHGPAIVAMHPLTRMTALDKRPLLDGRDSGSMKPCWFWRVTTGDHTRGESAHSLLPLWIMTEMARLCEEEDDAVGRSWGGGVVVGIDEPPGVRFPSERSALDALSQTLLSLARRRPAFPTAALPNTNPAAAV